MDLQTQYGYAEKGEDTWSRLSKEGKYIIVTRTTKFYIHPSSATNFRNNVQADKTALIALDVTAEIAAKDAVIDALDDILKP